MKTSNETITPRPAAHRDGTQIKTSKIIISKLPPFGKSLVDRQRFRNRPALVTINVGGNSWERAKKWQQHKNFAALVLTPEAEPDSLIWPVSGCPCLIEWALAAPEELIIELVICLLRSGALFVTVVPLFVDFSTPSHYFDTENQRWIQTRETVKTYYPKDGVSYAARRY